MDNKTLLNKISAGINIHLIVQYYKCARQDRQNEIDICLRNNLQNQYIHKIHVLTEEYFDFSGFPNEEKINQTVIGERLTFEKAFQHANQHQNDDVWLLSNADIYFDDSLKRLYDVSMNNKLFALTRHDVLRDGSIRLVEAAFAHGCQDAWVFNTPILLEKMETKFYLGIPGCDQKIAYEFIAAGYIVSNPSRIIIISHLDLTSEVTIDERTKKYISMMSDENVIAGKVAPPPYQTHIYPTDQLNYAFHELYQRFNESLKQLAERDFKICELYQQLAERDQQLAERDQQLAEFDNKWTKCERQLLTKEQQVHDLMNSWSWKITTLLRWIGSIKN